MLAATGGSSSRGTGGVGAASMAGAVAVLHAHVGSLQEALAATGLWSDRPELLATLTGCHFAALRDTLWAATSAGADARGGGGTAAAAAAAAWVTATRPLSEAAVAAAVAGAMFLPELWTAMVEEAVPWVAVHAPLGIMERLRAGGA